MKLVMGMIEGAAEAVFRFCFRVIGKEYTGAANKCLIQFVRFAVVGMSTTLIAYLIYSGILLLMKAVNVLPEFDYLVASVLSFVLSVLWSFYWNSRKVFVVESGKKRCAHKALIKTFISYSFTGLFVCNVLLVLWVRVFGISEFIAPIVNLLVTVPLNFLLNKFWAFKPCDEGNG